MDARDNTLIRSTPCEVCGEPMLWTQAAWIDTPASTARLPRAAYRCANGHVVDPATTPQCPSCGVHDSAPRDAAPNFVCRRCGASFEVPR